MTERDRNVFVGGRARVLINAIRFMEEEKRERVSRTPPNLEALQETNIRGRQEVGQAQPHGCAQALAELRPGVLSAWGGRGRAQTSYQNYAKKLQA